MPTDHFISLKKIDLSGTPVWNRHYYFTDTFYKLEPWRLIKTQDEGFIIVGRAIDINGSFFPPALANPFAFKVDQDGNVQWANIYQSNYGKFNDSVQTTIARVADDTTGSEGYIIVRSGAADQRYENRRDVCINALKIDVNGNLLWNKKYRLQNRISQDSMIADYPATIAHVEDSTSHFYFIAGTRRNISNTQAVRDSSLFFIGIDRDGNVVRPFHWVHIQGYPFNEDAIYDDNVSQPAIVLSYTHGNSRLVDRYMHSNRSQVGIMKLSRNLTITMMKYYWSPQMYDNRGVRIKRNPADDAYVVACDVSDSTSGVQNIAQLKTDKNGVPQYYYRYNINRNSGVFGLEMSYDQGSGTEYYNMVGFRSGNTKFGDELRIMATDASGITCGSDALQVHNSDYYDSVRLRTYAPTDTYGYWSINIHDDYIFQNQYLCDPAGAANFRQMLGVGYGNGRSEGISVYPTILSTQANEVSIASQSNGSIEAVLYSYDGRYIARNAFAPSAKVTWYLPDLPRGSYLLKVSQNGACSSFRVTRL